MVKYALVMVCALALAIGSASASMDELRAKLSRKFPGAGGVFGRHHQNHGAAAAASAGAYGASNGAAAAAAAAASSVSGNGYGSSAASASASAYSAGQQQAYRPAAYGNQVAASNVVQRQQQHAAPVVPRPAFNRFRVAPVYGGYSAAAAAASTGGANAGSAAGVANSGGYTAGGAGASTVNQNEYSENVAYNPAPTSYSAATGTFARTGLGSESSSYKRATENVENIESGRADDNHYYNAQSYGKAIDDNSHEAFADNDEDIIHTANMFRSKKKSVNYVNDSNKSVRESGSGVLAHDKHSSAYKKNFRKFNENVDQQNRREGDGFVESSNSGTRLNFDDEDEMSYDSDGLGTFQGVNGEQPAPYQGGGAAIGGGAASSVSGGSVATSAALAGRGGSASAASAVSGRRN